MSGVAVDLINIMATKLDFKLKLVPQSDYATLELGTMELKGSAGEVI